MSRAQAERDAAAIDTDEETSDGEIDEEQDLGSAGLSTFEVPSPAKSPEEESDDDEDDDDDESEEEEDDEEEKSLIIETLRKEMKKRGYRRKR